MSMWGDAAGRNAEPNPVEYVDLVAHPELEPDLGPTQEELDRGLPPADMLSPHAASPIPEPPAWEDELDASARFLYPAPPTLHDLWDAQAAPHDANSAGCSDAEYDRLVLGRQQTETAYREAHDRDVVRTWDAEQEAEAGS